MEQQISSSIERISG